MADSQAAGGTTGNERRYSIGIKLHPQGSHNSDQVAAAWNEIKAELTAAGFTRAQIAKLTRPA